MNKKFYLYTYDVKNKKVSVKNDKFKSIIAKMFDDKTQNVTKFADGNETLIVQDEDSYYSIDHIKKANKTNIDDDYIFFRIGKKREINGALKRNQNTFKGEEILSKAEQKIYELEICTYILVDLNLGIMMELSGQFAPTIKSFMFVINEYLRKNEKLKNINIEYKNVLTEKMIESFKNDGVKLGRIGYTYNIPNVSVLKHLGLDINQIKALEELNVFEIEVNIKNKPHIPLTKTSKKISYVVKAFEECKKDIKETIFFKGNTQNSGSKKYTYKEEEVTYSIPIAEKKMEDKVESKLSLEEMAEEVYIKLKDRYINNLDDIKEYIK